MITMTKELEQSIRDAFERATEELLRVRLTIAHDANARLQYRVRVASTFGPADNIPEIAEWCKSVWGQTWPANANGVWAFNKAGDFNFKYEADRTTFVMKWL